MCFYVIISFPLSCVCVCVCFSKKKKNITVMFVFLLVNAIKCLNLNKKLFFFF